MAKRKRRRGFGSVIQVKRLSGLGRLGAPSSGAGVALPVVFGGGTAALTTIGIRQFMTPTTPMQMSVVKNAPLVGIGAGALVGLIAWNMKSQPVGLGMIVSSVVVGGAMYLSEYAASLRLSTTAPSPTTAGLGAVVAVSPSGNGMNGRMGAVVLEPMAGRGVGSYGEVVNLGAINQKPFGTPGFQPGAN